MRGDATSCRGGGNELGGQRVPFPRTASHVYPYHIRPLNSLTAQQAALLQHRSETSSADRPPVAPYPSSQASTASANPLKTATNLAHEILAGARDSAARHTSPSRSSQKPPVVVSPSTSTPTAFSSSDVTARNYGGLGLPEEHGGNTRTSPDNKSASVDLVQADISTVYSIDGPFEQFERSVVDGVHPARWTKVPPPSKPAPPPATKGPATTKAPSPKAAKKDLLLPGRVNAMNTSLSPSTSPPVKQNPAGTTSPRSNRTRVNSRSPRRAPGDQPFLKPEKTTSPAGADEVRPPLESPFAHDSAANSCGSEPGVDDSRRGNISAPAAGMEDDEDQPGSPGKDDFSPTFLMAADVVEAGVPRDLPRRHVQI